MITKISEMCGRCASPRLSEQQQLMVNVICQMEEIPDMAQNLFASNIRWTDQGPTVEMDGANWLFLFNDKGCQKIEIPFWWENQEGWKTFSEAKRLSSKANLENEDHRGLETYEQEWWQESELEVGDHSVTKDTIRISLGFNSLESGDAIRIIPIEGRHLDLCIRFADAEEVFCSNNTGLPVDELCGLLLDAKVIPFKRDRKQNMDCRNSQYDGWEEEIADPAANY